MNILIYTFEPTGHALDEIEDAIEAALRNRGEVTGAGVGVKGANWDIEITDEAVTPEKALSILRRALHQFDLPPSTQIEIDGKKYGVEAKQ